MHQEKNLSEYSAESVEIATDFESVVLSDQPEQYSAHLNSSAELLLFLASQLIRIHETLLKRFAFHNLIRNLKNDP